MKITALRTSTCLPPLLMFVAILSTFAPLFVGSNFLPFSKYPAYTSFTCERGAGEPEFSNDFLALWEKNRFLFDVEPAWFTLNLPQDYYFASEIRKGRIPLWDPYTAAGLPTFESGQFKPFNPFKAVFYILPAFWTYSLFLFIQLLAGALGFYLWRLRNGTGEWTAAAAGLVYALNPWILSRIALTDGAGYLVFPWLLLALDCAKDLRPSEALFPALSLIWMGNAAHPEALALFSGTAFLHFLFRKEPLERKAVFLAFTGAVALVGLLPQWLPLMRYYLSAFPYKASGIVFLYEYSLKALFSAPSDLFIAPVLLCLLWFSWKGEKKPLFWTVCAAGPLLFISSLPFAGNSVAVFFERWTGFQAFYLKGLIWFSLAALASEGIDNISAKLRGAGSKWPAGISVLALSTIAAVVLKLHPLWEVFINMPAILAYLSIALGAALFLLFLAAGRAMPRDLCLFLSLLSVFAAFSPNFLDWNRSVLKENEAVTFLKKNFPVERTVSLGVSPGYILPPDWGQAFGTRQGEGNSAAFPNEFLQLFHSKGTPVTLVTFSRPELVLFQQLGASHLLAPAGMGLDALKKEFSGGNSACYRIPDAMGRFFFAKKAAARRSEPDLSKQIMELGGRLDGFVIVESLNKSALRLPAGDPGKWNIKVAADEPSRVECLASSEKGGILVLRDTWLKDWKAAVDGKDTEILLVNGCFKGVRLEPGDHRVVFRYRPVLTVVCLWVSFLVTLLAAAGAIFLVRRQGSEPPGTPVEH